MQSEKKEMNKGTLNLAEAEDGSTDTITEERCLEEKAIATDSDSTLVPPNLPVSINDHIHGALIENTFRDVKRIIVAKDVELIEVSSKLLSLYSLKCIEVETENMYFIKDASNFIPKTAIVMEDSSLDNISNLQLADTIMIASEESPWICRNPCCCCDCLFCFWCWCHVNCSNARKFRMPVVLYTPGDNRLAASIKQSHPVMVIERTCNCSFLESVQVFDGAANLIGSVIQKFKVWPLCGKFEVSDVEGKINYVIETPRLVTTLCILPEAKFVIKDTEGNEVGVISKVFGDMTLEAFTDSDKFQVIFPENCDSKMKALLLSAAILFDYIFYES